MAITAEAHAHQATVTADRPWRAVPVAEFDATDLARFPGGRHGSALHAASRDALLGR